MRHMQRRTNPQSEFIKMLTPSEVELQIRSTIKGMPSWAVRPFMKMLLKSYKAGLLDGIRSGRSDYDVVEEYEEKWGGI